MSPLCGTSHNARWWLCTDSCGLCCAAFTYVTILFSQSTITSVVSSSAYSVTSRVVHIGLFNVVAALALVSHMRAMLSDPGAVPKNAEPLPGDAARLQEAIASGASHRKRTKGWCHRCASYKPPRAHHDSVTNRCVVKLDHYCPWANNAIGVLNHKFFLLFIGYTFVLCMYALALLISFALAADTDSAAFRASAKRSQRLRGSATARGGAADDDILAVSKRPQGAVDDALMVMSGAAPQLSMSSFLVGISAILFGLFTSCMLCDQWSVFSTNVAKIDRLKGEELGTSTEVNEVFGGRSRLFALDWLLPTPVRFPESIHDDVMGYRIPQTLQQQQQQQHQPQVTPADPPETQKLLLLEGGGAKDDHRRQNDPAGPAIELTKPAKPARDNLLHRDDDSLPYRRA